ncbi:MAG: hypothetical protein RBT34_05505 [Anaerolineaceae bacterium]|jgi:YesN/AraC family two-component response regulator|nr:hypothetical protein [Anaerolineaceae bacterium]
MRLSLKYQPTPENAPKLASLIVQSALDVSNVVLDYSPRSLKDVDEVIEGFRQEGIALEDIASTLFCFGCYVGEIFVRNADAEWKNAADTPMRKVTNTPILIALPNANVTNPIGKVFKRFENGQGDNLEYFYQVFTK